MEKDERRNGMSKHWWSDIEYRDETTDRIAKAFHERYEWWAEKHGWSSQVGATVAWEDVPEANKRTMRSTVKSLLDEGVIHVHEERESAA